jgi:hypothetical protein
MVTPEQIQKYKENSQKYGRLKNATYEDKFLPEGNANDIIQFIDNLRDKYNTRNEDIIFYRDWGAMTKVKVFRPIADDYIVAMICKDMTKKEKCAETKRKSVEKKEKEQYEADLKEYERLKAKFDPDPVMRDNYDKS